MQDKVFKIKRNVIPILRGYYIKLKYFFYSHVSIGPNSRIRSGVDFVLHPGCFCNLGSSLNVGKNTTIAVQKYGYLKVGNDVGIGGGSQIICHSKISIGDSTITGPNVMIYDHNHEFSLENGVDRFNYEIDEVVVGKKCWIGAGSIILKGVHIGDNCVIGAGSVVTKDIPSQSVAVGSPARIIKTNSSQK